MHNSRQYVGKSGQKLQKLQKRHFDAIVLIGFHFMNENAPFLLIARLSRGIERLFSTMGFPILKAFYIIVIFKE